LLYVQDYERTQEIQSGRRQLIPRGVSEKVGNDRMSHVTHGDRQGHDQRTDYLAVSSTNELHYCSHIANSYAVEFCFRE